MADNNLSQFKKVIYSQWGEDGILEEIFRRLGVVNKYCVEFGAGGGSKLSNVWNLIKNNGWQGLLMENNKACLEAWQQLLKEVDNGTKILDVTVSIVGDNSLEVILDRERAPINLDLLSIDIDSNDYYILSGLQKYQPRVVIIEHNPTIPVGLKLVQEPNEQPAYGASLCSLVDLAHSKGYKLAAATHSNAIFVRAEEFDKLDVAEAVPEDVFDARAVTYLIQAYNGTCYFKNDFNVPSWRLFKNLKELKLNNKKSIPIPIGFSDEAVYAKSLSAQYRPVRVFWAEAEPVNLWQVMKDVFIKIINKIKK